MKRKKAGRKTGKTGPLLAKRLEDHFTGDRPPVIPGPYLFSGWPFEENGSESTPPPRTEIAGIPLPPDLEKAVRNYAGHNFWSLENDLTRPPWTYGPTGEDSEANYPGWKEADITPDGWHEIRRALETAFREGFFLALLRYADDLKRSAEAAPLLEGWRKAARKGAAARRAQAEPLRKAVCKRFRELRKTIPKKTVRYLKIAGELGISDRHVQRIVNEADLD